MGYGFLLNPYKHNNQDNDEDEICGKCIYHRKDEDWWICTQPSSECYGCCTEYNDGCEDFESRDNF